MIEIFHKHKFIRLRNTFRTNYSDGEYFECIDCGKQKVIFNGLTLDVDTGVTLFGNGYDIDLNELFRKYVNIRSK